MAELLRFFIILLFLSKAWCEDQEIFLIITPTVFYLKYIFLFGGITLVVIIRTIVELSIPFHIFSMLMGAAWGYGTLYSPWMFQMAEIALLIVDYLYEIILPPMLFNIGIDLDVNTFIRSLTQILIVSIPVSLLTATINGFVMRQVLDYTWSRTDALLFGILTNSLYPINVMRRLRETTIMTKHITILLEGETLISTAISVSIFQFLVYYREGILVHWYQFGINLVRISLGFPVGYLMGFTGTQLMKLAYGESANIMLLTIAMCYLSFYFGDYIANAGILVNMITAMMMSRERPALSREVDTSISYLWKMLAHILSGITFISIGVVSARTFGQSILPLNEYFIVFVTYLTSNVTRFLSFFCFSPILSRTGYGLPFSHMIICVWGSMRNMLCVHLAWNFIQREGPSTKAERFFLHTVGLFFLILLINGSFVPVLFRTMRFSLISSARHSNMNICMKYIYDARARMVAILKMDRLLSDANWPLVMVSTALTHPYKKTGQPFQRTEDEEEDENDEEYFMGYRFTYCPDCQKNIPKEPTAKEMKEMMKEGLMRLLKHKKTTFSRQYENGMLSKEGARSLLQAVNLAMESPDLVIHLDGLLEMFSNERDFHRFMRRNLQAITKTKDEIFKPPRRKWRLRCYQYIHSLVYNALMSLIIVVNMTAITLHFRISTTTVNTISLHLFILGNLTFSLLYLGEFFLKVLAYSWIQIYEDGVKTYFRSHWNKFEFIILLVSFLSVIMHIVVSSTSLAVLWPLDLTMNLLLAVRIFRIVLYLKIRGMCKKIADLLFRHFSLEMERNRATAYELGKNYIDGEEEILNNLEQIIDNDKIRGKLRKKLEQDRLVVTRRLGVAQMESPWVTTMVKTKMAIRTVLNSIGEDINELKNSGWVDDVEYANLTKSLVEKRKEIGTIRIVEPLSPKVLFREVPFMTDDEVVQYLYKHVSTRKYDPGNTVINQGDIVDGIYIVITGMFRIVFTPDKSLSEKMKETGAMPVIDYICSNTYDTEVVEYVMPGNVLGPLSVITERAYDGLVTAETHSEAFLLKIDVVKKAIAMDPDPVDGLECRIWKFIAFRKAMTLLMNVPFYHSYTQEKIKFVIERSFMPNLSNYKIFVVNEMMQDVLLIEGIVVDYNTRDIYIGPCHIPRAVQKLVLPRSSLVNVEKSVETKLMIIPAKDFDEYEIMMTEELACELVSQTSTKCLAHYVRERQKADSGAKSAKMKSLAKQMRKTAIKLDDTDKSKLKWSFTTPKGSTLSSRRSSRRSKSSKMLLEAVTKMK